MNNNKADRLIRQKVHAFEQNADAADADMGLLWERLQQRPMEKPLVRQWQLYRWAAAILILAGIGMAKIVSTEDSGMATTETVQHGPATPETKTTTVAAAAVAAGVVPYTATHEIREPKKPVRKHASKKGNAADLTLMTDAATAGLYINAMTVNYGDNGIDPNTPSCFNSEDAKREGSIF